MPVRDSDLGHQVIRVAKLFHVARARAGVSEEGVEPPTYGILFTLERGPLRLSDLSTCVHTEISTTSRQVTSLARAGLVEKVPDPDDGRAQLIRVTGAGHQTMRRLRDRRDSWLAGLLEDWDPEDVHTLARLLRRLNDEVETSLNAKEGIDE
jgi:DNA-binding MarR family transcriptional regulator